ncbi:MAG: hypothetical protein RLZZ78_359, partial [Armatimonadota bacterium]
MAREAVKMVTSGHYDAVANDRHESMELAPPDSKSRLNASVPYTFAVKQYRQVRRTCFFCGKLCIQPKSHPIDRHSTS